jgi:predicted nucleic acid-binding protein
MVTERRALADTSIFVGMEARRFEASQIEGYEWGISAVTLGELRLSVLQATDPEAVSRRLSTFQLAHRFAAIPINEAVSDAWALLVSKLRAAGRKAPINDSWIAATAIAYGVPVITQDSDYDDMPDLEVIKIPMRRQNEVRREEAEAEDAG